ncbi:MAG: hypothetical protein QNJ29_10925 [Rhizobiaceae bacterium]|nr:hypothetical protein [Rhizobiaceae bacterium]
MTVPSLTKNIALAFVVSAGTFAVDVTTSHASDSFVGGALRQNAEGRRACGALQQQGGTYWEAKIRGRFIEGNRGGGNHFSVRNCFRSSASCQTYINRIGNIIYPIEEIRYARCKAR